MMKEQALLQRLRRSREDSIWLNEHYDELKLKYPDEWVASFKKKVVGHNKVLKTLIKELQEKYPKDAGDIAIEFVSPKKVELIL